MSFFCGQKPSHLRSHSTRRKMMMICFKWRVSSFAVSLKSLYPFIPESNRKSSNTSFFMRTKRKPPEVAFKATKDDDDLFQKKSVIFCWLTEVTLCHELPWITKWDQWLLKLLEKSLFFLQNTPPYSNTGQRTTASVPLPLHQTYSDQNRHTQHLQSSLTAELQYQTWVPQPCQV